mgnify:CR=1 FL=1
MGLVDSLADVFGGAGAPGSPASLASRNIAGGEVPSNLDQYSRVNGLIGTLDSLVKAAETANGASGATGRMSPLGLDAIIQDWVRQQFIYRRSILQDLYVFFLLYTFDAADYSLRVAHGYRWYH